MPHYLFFKISKVTKIIIVHPIWTQEHLTWAKEKENYIIFYHQKEDQSCFKAENILFEKIWSKFEVRNLVFILGWTIYNKNIVELSIIYVIFIYCNHKSILKFMLKIISVRHYKNQDIIVKMPRYPPQQCTEWHSMAIQEYYSKVQMIWLWEKKLPTHFDI